MLLSTIIRSLGRLESLLLNQNRFTDAGIECLFGPDCYSATVKLLNLARNTIGTRSAYYLGLMFNPEQRRGAQLDCLILGGSTGSKSFGEDFLRVLFFFLSQATARPVVGIFIRNLFSL